MQPGARIAIIGAGMAGLACAARLTAAGIRPALFDKGRGPGGRMSSRRVSLGEGEVCFDHGAQYFTARDPGFQAQVADWQRLGLVAPWPAAGTDCWVGTPTMNAPLRHCASALPVCWNRRVERISASQGGWVVHGDGLVHGRGPADPPFDAVLLAVPSENAQALLDAVAPSLAARAASTPAAPCWTVMAAFAARVPTNADVLQPDGAIGWAARNSAKPGRTGPEAWVLQARPDWSRAHLEQTPDEIVAALLAAFATLLGAACLPALLTAAAHRWRYARSGNAGDGMLWEAGLGIGVCGDWLLGPRVECAWVSGDRLGRAVAAACA